MEFFGRSVFPPFRPHSSSLTLTKRVPRNKGTERRGTKVGEKKGSGGAGDLELCLARITCVINQPIGVGGQTHGAGITNCKYAVALNFDI